MQKCPFVHVIATTSCCLHQNYKFDIKTISWHVVVFTKLIIASLIKGDNNTFDLIIATAYNVFNVNVKAIYANGERLTLEAVMYYNT